MFHNVGDRELTIDLSLYTDISFDELRGYAGYGLATLEGQILTISRNTTVVLK